MASWGNAKLSFTALQRIQEVNEELVEDHLPGIQGELLRVVLDKKNTPPPKPYGLLMDLPKPVCSQVVIAAEEKFLHIDMQQLAAKIVETVCSNQSGINIVIDLISKVTDDRLDDLVMRCWSNLQDEHKKSFVVAMSATRTTALCVGSQILLPLLSELETFQTTVQTYGPVFGWLEGIFSVSTVAPLLLNAQSPINRDPSLCKMLLNHLSEIQKTEAVVIVCKSINELHDCHLQSLSLILESPPIDPSVVQPVTSMLSSRMSDHSENRTVGKIILTLISLLSASTLPHVYSELSTLASHFKGPLRFRHKQALAAISKQILIK